jgi:uncharacterized protein (DUF2267 family)
MELDFEKYAAQGNELINLLAEDMQVPKDKAGRLIQLVLHALRNRISIGESIQLVAYLPMPLKGVYVDGWKIRDNYKRIKHLRDFIDEMNKESSKMPDYDLINEEETVEALKALFRTINNFNNEPKANEVNNILPEELQQFILEN